MFLAGLWGWGFSISAITLILVTALLKLFSSGDMQAGKFRDSLQQS